MPPSTASRGSTSLPGPAVELRDVTLSYGEVAALRNVTLSLAQGERVCVLGANGSGKSTLASVIAGLLAPDDGSVMLMGQAVRNAAGSVDFAAYAQARTRIGLVFQNPDDQIVTTVVADDVAFGPENLNVAPAQIGLRVERELRRVALSELAHADPTRLSGGQKQRVAIAGALAMNPSVLVLDEPGALLDVRGRRGIRRVMGELSDTGVTVVHVTHFMDEALDANRVIVLDRGSVVLDGAPCEVFAHGERLAALGLELPFAGRISTALRTHGAHVPFTCDGDALVNALAGTLAGNPAPSMPKPRDCPGPHEGQRRSAASTSPAIDVRGVSYSYATADAHGRGALRDVTLRVAPGTHAAVIGHTGSGKSTLLRLLCALSAPAEGEVWVDGIATGSRRNRRRLLGRVGYVMQHPERQLFGTTVWEDVAFGPRNLGLSPSEVAERTEAALQLVGLAKRRADSPFQLSGGQQRLCALAGVLALRPRIIVLDEPTAGLDPRGRAGIRSLLADVCAAGITIVEVTHDMSDAALADQVIALAGGTVIASGNPREVFSDDQATTLRAQSLGRPAALTFARRLEAVGFPSLGAPLSDAELVDAIAAALSQRATTRRSEGSA